MTYPPAEPGKGWMENHMTVHVILTSITQGVLDSGAQGFILQPCRQG
jgi:hypothetical protein